MSIYMPLATAALCGEELEHTVHTELARDFNEKLEREIERVMGPGEHGSYEVFSCTDLVRMDTIHEGTLEDLLLFWEMTHMRRREN